MHLPSCNCWPMFKHVFKSVYSYILLLARTKEKRRQGRVEFLISAFYTIVRQRLIQIFRKHRHFVWKEESCWVLSIQTGTRFLMIRSTHHVLNLQVSLISCGVVHRLNMCSALSFLESDLAGLETRSTCSLKRKIVFFPDERDFCAPSEQGDTSFLVWRHGLHPVSK